MILAIRGRPLARVFKSVQRLSLDLRVLLGRAIGEDLGAPDGQGIIRRSSVTVYDLCVN